MTVRVGALLWSVALLVNIVSWAAGQTPRAATPPEDPPGSMSVEEARRLFRRQVLPLLQTRCLSCHGTGGQIEGGLDLRNRGSLLAGGDSGAAIVVGQADQSLLIRAVRRDGDLRMPPKEADRLEGPQVEILERWVNAGAPWPEDDGSPGPADGEITVSTTRGLSADWNQRRYAPADVWAYRPLTRPRISRPASHPVDALLADGLAAAGLVPAGRATDTTLLRRLTLDLTGIVPLPDESPEEVAPAVVGSTDEPFDALWLRRVERLLAHPRYGEQQARYWLDVTRYADSSGLSNDYERPHAWRYRDYVVRSFQADKPYDRFIVEQLAGDELAPDDPESQIAVGFLRMGPWEHTAMSVAALTRQQFLDDVTHSVGVTFLGQSLRCAACHDHKFDPIPTRDYYRLQAVFAPVQFTEVGVPFLPVEPQRGDPRDVERWRRLLASAEAERRSLPRDPEGKLATVDARSRDKLLQKRSDYLRRSLARYEPRAFSVYSGPNREYASAALQHERPAATQRQGPAPATHILLGGSLESTGELVSPGVLSAVDHSNDEVDPQPWNQLPTALTGRRLALARWIADPRNTLTARVMANRLWQQHFGRGIVASANNFGRTGARPSHPELLDYLALWLSDHDWSLQSLQRLIVTSEAYCRRSDPVDEVQAGQLRERDPLLTRLAVFPPRRLAAEELRDSLLAVTGELNGAAGGPPAEPEIHWEVALQPRHIMGSVAPAYQPAPRPAARHRRTIYTLRLRTLPDPLLEVFNRPGPDLSCDVRESTLVAPQALTLFNGQFVHDRALALAGRLEREAASAGARLTWVFQRLLLRAPSAAERVACWEHVERQSVFHGQQRRERRVVPTRVQREMVEELTGEMFRWEEELDRLREYQADLQPWEVGPETRAWADLCLVLMNSSEFLWIR
ncbi:MAG: PSD1 and planctomycete cytochrome C domain-containing protein [Pirellulales bacterium]